MSLERITLDSGEVAGVSWEAIGISPACAWELTATFGSIRGAGVSFHPLQLISAERREQLALEMVLCPIARTLDCRSESVMAASEAIRALPAGDAKVDAAKRVADRWVRLRAATLRAADDRAEALAAAA